MWEANVRTTVSKIIANLNEQHPDEWWDGMADMVSDLDADNAFETNEGRHVESEASPPVLKNQKASDIHAELEAQWWEVFGTCPRHLANPPNETVERSHEVVHLSDSPALCCKGCYLQLQRP